MDVMSHRPTSAAMLGKNCFLVIISKVLHHRMPKLPFITLCLWKLKCYQFVCWGDKSCTTVHIYYAVPHFVYLNKMEADHTPGIFSGFSYFHQLIFELEAMELSHLLDQGIDLQNYGEKLAFCWFLFIIQVYRTTMLKLNIKRENKCDHKYFCKCKLNSDITNW